MVHHAELLRVRSFSGYIGNIKSAAVTNAVLAIVVTALPIASTYRSWVDQPIQRLFYALSARLNYRVYGGDAQDAFAHSPGPSVATYVHIDDAYADWYHATYGIHLDRSFVLPSSVHSKDIQNLVAFGKNTLTRFYLIRN
jgi:hypothetical protein